MHALDSIHRRTSSQVAHICTETPYKHSLTVCCCLADTLFPGCSFASFSRGRIKESPPLRPPWMTVVLTETAVAAETCPRDPALATGHCLHHKSTCGTNSSPTQPSHRSGWMALCSIGTARSGSGLCSPRKHSRCSPPQALMFGDESVGCTVCHVTALPAADGIGVLPQLTLGDPVQLRVSVTDAGKKISVSMVRAGSARDDGTARFPYETEPSPMQGSPPYSTF